MCALDKAGRDGRIKLGGIGTSSRQRRKERSERRRYATERHTKMRKFVVNKDI